MIYTIGCQCNGGSIFERNLFVAVLVAIDVHVVTAITVRLTLRIRRLSDGMMKVKQMINE